MLYITIYYILHHKKYIYIIFYIIKNIYDAKKMFSHCKHGTKFQQNYSKYINIEKIIFSKYFELIPSTLKQILLYFYVFNLMSIFLRQIQKIKISQGSQNFLLIHSQKHSENKYKQKININKTIQKTRQKFLIVVVLFSIQVQQQIQKLVIQCIENIRNIKTGNLNRAKRTHQKIVFKISGLAIKYNPQLTCEVRNAKFCTGQL
eukprot:TRINITY_DN4652_c2_g1_i1.p1 TRINITY_DN4652_c2_g1~~TRINITY_DN4652_c2_g1_i1.p1  ORF type:complete len:204 (+),score=-17.16 TRINITY_DN4652_c2_g1_i1:409-1020(+)